MSISRIGLGLAALARPAYITSSRGTDLGADRTVDSMRAQSWGVLDRAYALGIRYIDLARSYGRSEEFAAGWLNAHPDRDDVVIGSKWGYRYVGEWRDVALEIDGSDLIAAGLSQGPALGRGLAEALRRKLDGEAGGREQELAVALEAARSGDGVA